jgi:hypothetical protein
MPELVELQERHGESLRVVAVSLDLQVSVDVTTAEGVLEFARKREFDSLEILVLEGEADDVLEAWGFPGGVPYSFVLNDEGELVDHEAGPADLERLEELAAAARR